MFKIRKKAVLDRQDQSKKGSVDKEIAPLVDLINSSTEFYTTSSCAGRIVLLVEPKSKKKKDFEWLLASHSIVTVEDIKKRLFSPPDDLVWLKMEPFILHICVKDIDTANDFMDLLVKAGLKHSGILSTKNRIIIEIVGNERIEIPVSEKNELLVDDIYLKFIVGKANEKLIVCRRRMDILKEMFEKDFMKK